MTACGLGQQCCGGGGGGSAGGCSGGTGGGDERDLDGTAGTVGEQHVLPPVAGGMAVGRPDEGGGGGGEQRCWCCW